MSWEKLYNKTMKENPLWEKIANATEGGPPWMYVPKPNEIPKLMEWLKMKKITVSEGELKKYLEFTLQGLQQ